MTATDRAEAFAIGAALVRSLQDHDDEARRIIMDGADLEAVCQALARVTAAVLRVAAGGDDCRASAFIDVWQDEARQALAAITED
jgi:hypothetical protein